MKKHLLLIGLLSASAALAQKAEDSPSGTRITPPTISVVSPQGFARGLTAEINIEGFNLANASAIYFSEKGVKGTIVRIKELPDLPDIRLGSNGGISSIDLGPLPPRNQVTVELDISSSVPIGPVSFRLLTPLGTSPVGTFLVEPFYGEVADAEPNDAIDNAVEVNLPAILVGTISRNGDVDNYKLTVKAGQQVVFENGAVLLGSSLQPRIKILREDQSLVAEFGQDGMDSVRMFAHKFDKAGVYYLQVTDFQGSGRGGHTYRIKAGDLPLVTNVYPLGMPRGKKVDVKLDGYGVSEAKLSVEGKPSERDSFAVMLRPELKNGLSFNEVRLELGDLPELEASAATGSLKWPVTINGKLKKAATYRFAAKKGEDVILEVFGKRGGSDLDSFLEVVDAAGKPIERGVLRPVWETSTVLRDHDSAQRGIRLQSWNAIKVGDYVLMGSELMRVTSMPRTPDDDMIFESFNGQRLAYMDTTAEAHAIDSPVYKVQIHPAGKQFTPNGLPLMRLYYRNDDGGPGYSKDSLLHFTAPAEGEYQVRLTDVRGELKDAQPYRLTIRRPEPDFRIRMLMRNPNVPPGSAIPFGVSAFRTDGFDGPITVTVEGLPKGVTAAPAVIPPGQVNTVVMLKSEANLEGVGRQAWPLRVVGRASGLGGKQLVRVANEDDNLKLLSFMPKPDVVVSAITKVVELEPGGTAEVNLSVLRQNGFKGRIPVNVMNLPPSVRVLDVGLNGVLINEDEDKRGFTLEALPDSEPLEQPIYVGGQIETRSPQQNVFAAPQVILLRVKPAKGVPAERALPVGSISSAPGKN